MQANVDKILEAANAINRFEFVDDEPFDENDLYPAFIIQERRSEIKKKTESLHLYMLEWQYQGFVLIEKEKGWEELEILTAQLLTELAARNLYLADWRMMEALISDRDIIISEIIIGALNKHDFS